MPSVVEIVSELVFQRLEDGGTPRNFELDEPLAEDGLSSFMFVGLLISIEERFGIQVPDELATPECFSTINRIASIVSDCLEEQA